MDAKVYSFPYNTYLVQVTVTGHRAFYTRIPASNIEHCSKIACDLYKDAKIVIMGTTEN